MSSSGGTVSVVALLTATINTITAGLSGGFVGIGGSVAVNLLGSEVSAYIAASSVTALLQVLVNAVTTDQLQAIAGDVSGGVVAAAGTVVVNNMDNSTRAYVEDATVSATSGEVDVWANSVEQPNPNGDGDTLVAVNVSGGLVGVGGVVSVNTVDDITQAFIASSRVNPNLSLDLGGLPVGTVSVRASSQDNLVVISGGLSGGFVGASGTVDRSTISSQTSAFISSSDESGNYFYPTAPSVVYGYHVLVSTVANESVPRTVVGGGLGAVGVAGAVSVLNVNVTNNAFVHDSDVYAVRNLADAGYQGDLTITANDTTSVSSKVGTLAGGVAGAGASINVNTIENTVEAEVIGGHLNTLSALTVAAVGNESITPFTGTGSLGAVALAGAVAADTIDTTTQAVIENGVRPSLINQDPRFQAGGAFAANSAQTVSVTANDTALLDARTGSVSVGADGAGAAIDVGAIRNRTVAEVGTQTVIAAVGNVSVTSQANHTIDSVVVAFSGGLAALSGAVSVLSLGANTDPTAANQFDASGGGTDLMQQTDQSMATPNLTSAINYQPGGTAPDAAQAGSDVNSLGQATVDGEITAIAASDRVTGAFVDSADSAADAASITSGGAITIDATNDYDVQQTTGDANLGLGAVGAAIGVTSIQNNTQAYVGDYASLRASGAISIQAADQDDQPTHINGIAGAAGLYLAATANVARLNFTSNTTAELQSNAVILGAAAVTIAADQQSNIDVQGQGYQGGLAAIGAVVAAANVTANVNASVADGASVGSTAGKIGSLSVLTTTDNTVNTSALVGSDGAGAGSYGQATATVTLDGGADLGSAIVQAAGAVSVIANSTQLVTATSNELSPGIVTGLGDSEPTADVEGSLSAYVANGASIGAGSLSVTAQSTDNATADAQAFGTGLVTGPAADAECDVNVDTEAYVAAATITLSGSASITATSTETATANSGKLPQNLVGNGGNFGALAYGSVLADASVASPTEAYIDGATITAGGGVDVSAVAADQTTANSYCLTVGVIFAGLNSKADATTIPAVDAWISGAGVQTGGDVDVTADAKTGAASNVVGLSAGIASAGPTHSYATDSPDVNAFIGPNSLINAGGNISVQGVHDSSAGTGAKATADASLAGIAGYGGADPEATAGATVNVYVSSGGVLQANGAISLEANSSNYGDAQANSLFAGVFGAGTSSPTTTVNARTMAHMDGTITGGQSLTILSQSSNVGTADGTSGSGTLIGGVGVNAQTAVSPWTQASIGDDADVAAVRVSGDVNVTSQATDGATADATAGNYGLVALGTVIATATLAPTVTTFLGNNSSVASTGGSVSLAALHNYEPNGSLVAGMGAQASASGAGGDKSVDAGVISINSLAPSATANATVMSDVNPGATINAADNVALTSQSDNTADSTAGILNFGVVGYGGVASNASASGTTQAQLVAIQGLLADGNLSAIALGTDGATSTSTADGGGVLNIDGSAANANDFPTVLAALSSANWSTSAATPRFRGWRWATPAPTLRAAVVASSSAGLRWERHPGRRPSKPTWALEQT